MSIPSTTWWPSRSIPPRSSITPATGCHGITRPASPSTILDEPALPNILNQTLTAVLQPGGLGNVYPSASSPADFFPLRRLAGNSRHMFSTQGKGVQQMVHLHPQCANLVEQVA